MSYIVTDLGPVHHNGKLFEEGDTISSLTEEQAAPLLELGVIATAPAKPPAKPAKGED